MTTSVTPGTALAPIAPQMSQLPAPATPAFVENDLQTWLDREAERQQAFLAAIPETKAAILGALFAAGVVRVRVDYDGYGDSGQMNDFIATLVDGSEKALADISALGGDATLPSQPLDNKVDDGSGRLNKASVDDKDVRSLADTVEAFCYDLLDAHHDGYENNEGGSGEFVFDVEAGTISLCHHDNFISVDTTEHEF